MEDSRKQNAPSGKAVLIYDGNCPICSNTVKWIRENEEEEAFEMLPCQSEYMKKRYPFIEEAVCMQAMQLVLPGGSVLAGEKALPEIFSRLKRYQVASLLFKLPGAQTFSRVFYRWFANRRYHIAKILFPGNDSDRHRHD